MSASEEWDKLCEEHAAARDAHFKALAGVNQRFHTSNNPTADELDKSEEAWDVMLL